ncbi:S9 family peptidase [Cellvibrio sp. PSBB006]|uniref:alpha/beta hydrolase family protein n=1 Tax=Cellvibrio sp. PSBB006 TaxID=1987723 RepID=UPI000B3B33B9|nr:alpha/beta fold hydrolase [Cellvibrio sp. PSBB006]ARU28207.1 hypothetical protein CBR65_12650 [Cellvibrio sp. PSBB006]
MINSCFKKRFFSAILGMCLVISLPSYSDVSIEQIFRPPLITTMVIRPDGKAILSLKEENHIRYLSLTSIPQGDEKRLFTPSEYGSDKSMVGGIVWLDNRYFAINFFEPKAGIADLMDTKTSRRLLIVDSLAPVGSKEQVLNVKTPGWLVDTLPAVDGEFLYAKSGIQSRIYKLKVDLLTPDKKALSKSDKIDGGQFVAENQIIQVDGYATRWFSKKGGGFKSVLHFTEPYVLSLTEFGPDGKHEQAFSWRLLELDKDKSKDGTDKSIENYLPLALGPADSEYYCLDRLEDESKSLYRVNFKTKSQTLIYETSAFKIVDLVFSPDHQLIGVQVLKNERLSFEPLAQQAVTADTTIGENLVLTAGSSADANKKLVYEESHNQPGQYWLETQSPKQRTLMGDRYPWLVNQLKSKQVEGSLNVEGIDIPYLLNLPVSSTKVPLIVMPHGGPIGIFDSPYFDHYTQLFSARGYAVLRVNFRGSGGRSKQLREAGKKEWGDLILKDIYEATRTVIQRADVDQSRVCLFGISYGGYASSMLLIKHPDVYQCAVAVAGVYDLNLHLQSAQLSEQQDQWSKEYIGDYRTEYDALKLISPAFLADKLQRPLLLLHGDQDEVVDIEQSARFKFSLDKANKKAEFIRLEKMGHSVTSSEEAERLLSPSLEFLHANLM